MYPNDSSMGSYQSKWHIHNKAAQGTIYYDNIIACKILLGKLYFSSFYQMQQLHQLKWTCPNFEMLCSVHDALLLSTFRDCDIFCSVDFWYNAYVKHLNMMILLLENETMISNKMQFWDKHILCFLRMIKLAKWK